MSTPYSGPVRIGIIGGGLMGREAASAFGRWFALEAPPVPVRLTAVCDLNPAALNWFERIETIACFTSDHRELLARDDVDVVYVALPHNLHERIYLDVLEAGKDLLAEKPFGIDLDAARNVAAAAERLGRFVRISSEFPFLPGAQRVRQLAESGELGRILQARAGFLHSSDLDPEKPINWKRRNATCGEIGVMGDLGMHVAHLPLRLGWKLQSVYAQLQRPYSTRPDGKGGQASCETWDNATLHCQTEIRGQVVPLDLEMKRLAPGETNTWFIEITGTEGGARFSTKEPKTLWQFERGREQWWRRTDLGFSTPFRTITGGIFEPGFPDILMQMWAAFLAERAGLLDGRFGCVTPVEAVASHKIWAAALQSQHHNQVVSLE